MVKLVEISNASDIKAIEGFIRKTGNLIWLDILFREFLRALRYCSGLMILFGLFNVVIYAISPVMVLVTLSLPVMFAAFSTLKKKPGNLDTAKVADERLDNRLLLTTAIELLHSPLDNVSQFAPWVIRQASQMARLRAKQLNAEFWCGRHRMPWPELGSVLVGLFLILQPGKSYERPVFGNSPGTHELPTPVVEAARTSLIEEIRSTPDAVDPQASAFSNHHHRQASSDPTFSAARHGQKPANRSDVLELATGTETTNSTDASIDQPSATTRKIFDHVSRQRAPGIGAEADNEPTETDYQQTENRPLKLININLPDGIPMNSDNGTQAFQDYRFNVNGKRLKPPATADAAKKATGFASVLTFSQQYYVSAYYQKIHSKK